MPTPEAQHLPQFEHGDFRCAPTEAAPPPPTAVQWMVVITTGPISLWSPLPINVGLLMEQFHGQETRLPSSVERPRIFHLPILQEMDARPILFGTGIPYRTGLALRVNMRSGNILIPIDSAPGQACISRPVRRVLLTQMLAQAS